MMVRGNALLEEHELLESRVGDRFEAFVFDMLAEYGIAPARFAETLRAFERMRETLDHLEAFP